LYKKKHFSTKDQVVVEHCMLYFERPSVLEVAMKRKRKFMQKFAMSENNLCGLFTEKAATELNKL